MTRRSLRGLVLGTAVLVAIAIVAGSADMIGHAAETPGSRTAQAHPAVHALEPGYTGTFLYRNDSFRTGQNLAESVLTPTNVNQSQFGLLFADSIDGAAYAEPLYVPGVSIPGQGTHNVVYVATENDSVYAFDADQPGPPLWYTSFINPAAGITAVPATDIGKCADITPIIGITATPVIDPTAGTAGTLYVVSKVKLGPGNYQQQLHALDITTGSEQQHSPVTIAASVPGNTLDSVKGVISFNPLLQQDRPALTLANGVVYLSFASHCDTEPYHGWILGYDQTTLAQVVVYNTSPNGVEAGIWESGCGPGIDTNGDLIVITGNGTFDPGPTRNNYGDSFLRLTPGGGTMSVASYFTPLDEQVLADEDLDMGSGGGLMLPDQPGPNPHLVVGAGKIGTIYLVNRDSMGGFNAGGDQNVQEVSGTIPGMFSTPGYWQGMVPGVGLQNMVYTVAEDDQPKMFVLSNGLLQTPPTTATINYTFGFPGASPVISANGTTGGILWAIDAARWQTGGTAILFAFDATNIQSPALYDSDNFVADHPGPAVKFTVPTVANGSVYVGTQTQLAVFGLFPGGSRGAATPTATATATSDATATVTATSDATATVTATSAATATATDTATATATSDATATATGTVIATATATATQTFSVTPTLTSTPTSTATATASNTPTPTATPTVSATATTTPSQVPTTTATATPTLTATPTASPSPAFATLMAKPTSLSFSSQVVGHQSKPANVKLTNTAAGTAVTLGPAISGGFVMTSSNCPSVMPPKSSCTISIASAPTGKGKQSGQLQLNSNARFGVRTIKLKGKGMAARIRTRPKSLSFEPLSADAVSSSQSITVINDSPAPISFTTAPAATPPFNVTANTCNTIAANGGTCTVSVEFAPHKHGRYSGTLELHDTAGNSPQHIKLFGRSK